jgi:hypothetical protein
MHQIPQQHPKAARTASALQLISSHVIPCNLPNPPPKLICNRARWHCRCDAGDAGDAGYATPSFTACRAATFQILRCLQNVPPPQGSRPRTSPRSSTRTRHTPVATHISPCHSQSAHCSLGSGAKTYTNTSTAKMFRLTSYRSNCTQSPIASAVFTPSSRKFCRFVTMDLLWVSATKMTARAARVRKTKRLEQSAYVLVRVRGGNYKKP